MRQSHRSALRHHYNRPMPAKTTDPAAATRAELRRKTKELAAIREISHYINATADVRAILAGITQTTTKVMHVDSTSIYLLDKSSSKLVLKATTGLYPQAVDHGYLKMGEGLTGWAAQHRRNRPTRSVQPSAPTAAR